MGGPIAHRAAATGEWPAIGTRSGAGRGPLRHLRGPLAVLLVFSLVLGVAGVAYGQGIVGPEGEMTSGILASEPLPAGPTTPGGDLLEDLTRAIADSPDTDTDTDTEEPGEPAQSTDTDTQEPAEPAEGEDDGPLDDSMEGDSNPGIADVLDAVGGGSGAGDASADPVVVAPAGPGVVHLTFDDGPHPSYTPAILDILARHEVRATFFVLGSLAEAYPDLIDRIVAEGHTVANHTWNHEDLTTLSREQFDRTIGRTQALLGPNATPCLRPPFGSFNDTTRAWAADHGLELILWDVDTRDWQKPGAGVIADRIVTGIEMGGTNVLLHDGGGERTQSIEGLALALDQLADRDLRFEPVC